MSTATERNIPGTKGSEESINPKPRECRAEQHPLNPEPQLLPDGAIPGKADPESWNCPVLAAGFGIWEKL